MPTYLLHTHIHTYIPRLLLATTDCQLDKAESWKWVMKCWVGRAGSPVSNQINCNASLRSWFSFAFLSWPSLIDSSSISHSTSIAFNCCVLRTVTMNYELWTVNCVLRAVCCVFSCLFIRWPGFRTHVTDDMRLAWVTGLKMLPNCPNALSTAFVQKRKGKK